MSRHRRAAPSISAAAPKAARRRRLASSGPAWPGEPRTASPATGTVSSLTLARRVARSITGVGSSVSRGALGSTRNSVSPSGVRAGTRSTSATWAHGTKRLVPVSAQPFAVLSARVWVASGRQSRSASRNAPAEFFRSCWSGLNAKSMVSGLQAVGAYFLGQAEHAFADDVLLDLGRARVDRARPRPQKRGRPRAGLAGRGVDLLELFVRGDELPPRAQDLERQLVVALLELGVRELGDRRGRTGRLALLERRQRPQRGVALDLELGVDLAHLRAHDGIIYQALAAARELLGGPDELGEGDRVARDAAEGAGAALVAERGLRDLPPLVEAADEIPLLGARVGHEDLREERGAGDLLERTHLDAWLAHVEEHARDALVLGRLRVGAREQDPPVGDRPARGPDLLAVDEEVVALVLGARLEAREVRAGVGLRVELAPDLLGREHPLQVALLLPVGPVDDDRRADEADPEPVDRRRRADPRHLVLDDRLLHRRGGPAAVLRRPQHPHLARPLEPPVPSPSRVDGLQIVLGDVGLEPAPD